MAGKLRLTEAQTRILSDIAKGDCLMRAFDVYGPKPDGYWWHWQQGAPVTRRSAEKLIECGVIALSDEVRPYSGRRIATASITPAGRALLSSSGKTGE